MSNGRICNNGSNGTNENSGDKSTNTNSGTNYNRRRLVVSSSK